MSLHECPECDTAVATNDTTAGAFSVPPTIVCATCGVEMDCDPDVEVDMEQVRA